MRAAQDKVKIFHEKAGALIASRPEVPDCYNTNLRLSLIHEELEELEDAFGEDDIVGVADAIGDLLYVVLGTAVSCGIDIAPVFDEIHRSNLTKFLDGHRREDGKWVKGPSYTPADLKSIIDKQLHNNQ